jgi:biotin carboxylase
LVLKPTESAGSDGVFVCTSDAEIKNAFNSILGSTNKLLHVNEEVLAQEFVDGVEYVVNTVSCGGRHHIVLVWRYKKNRFGGAVVYDTDTMVDSNDPDFDFDVLEQYTYRLLDSLGITNGPAHSEIMIDSDGPVLIEVGARMDGVVSPVLDARCVGYSQLDLTLDSYLEPDLVSVKTRQGYRLLENAVIVHLIANRAGVVQDIPGASEITRLKSFVEMNLKVSVGGVLCRTLDLFTSPGHVFLASQDRGTLLSDCDKIRGIEGEGRFFSLI